MALSRGNAHVESGFSANEEMLVEIMWEGSLVVRRMVFVGVMNEADICNIDVNRKMLKFVNKTHSEYVKQLERASQFRWEKKSWKKKNHKLAEESKRSKVEFHRTT